MLELSTLLPFAKELAKAAGALVRAERQEVGLTRDYKQGVELVTQADMKSEQLILQRIAQDYPEHQVLAEETANDHSGLAQIEGPLWVIDPIDGTVNYAHHHQQVGISIAFCLDGETQIAVVYNPFTDELFHAVRGQGAWLNDRPIQVSGKQDLRRSLVATGFPYHKESADLLMARLSRVFRACADIRRIGAASIDLCWVACGRLDAYYEQELKPWDMAAGWLIAKEAGAVCSHLEQAPEGYPQELYSIDLVVATPAIHHSLVQLIRGD